MQTTDLEQQGEGILVHVTGSKVSTITVEAPKDYLKTVAEIDVEMLSDLD